MGEATRKRDAVHSLVVGRNYGDAGTYKGHGTGVLIDPDSSVGGVFRYYVFEQAGGKRVRKQKGDVLELLRKVNIEPLQQA